MRYVTVGEAVHRSVTPYGCDMSWLGDAPSERIARWYEVARERQHVDALKVERAKLEALAKSVASEFVETPRQKERQTKALNEISSRIAVRCACDICRI